VRSDGGKNVIVWRNEKAHSEGVALISVGVNKTNPAVLLPSVPASSRSVTRSW
jgi:hypothetical protein